MIKMIYDLLKSTGNKNYKWFCKMFNMWNSVMYNNKLEMNDNSIMLYFKDLYCYTYKYYYDFDKFELNFDEKGYYYPKYAYYWLDIVPNYDFRIYTKRWFIFHKQEDVLHIHTDIIYRILKFNYFLDGIKQRKYNKNSI